MYRLYYALAGGVCAILCLWVVYLWLMITGKVGPKF